MSELTRLREWLEDNPPDQMPYWPGARITGRVGLRSLQMLLDMGVSPLHLGVDRAGGGQYTMPFDGRIEWTKLHEESAWGSFLRIRACHVDLEIHVGHTECPDCEVTGLEDFLKKGQKMPVAPGALGQSTAVHTHTEVVLPYNEDIRGWIMDAGCDTIVRQDGSVAEEYVEDHCLENDLNFQEVMDRIWRQIGAWGIEEATTVFAVRKRLPVYRKPVWDAERVMLIDSQWLLQI
jgi:hypothetical protein